MGSKGLSTSLVRFFSMRLLFGGERKKLLGLIIHSVLMIDEALRQ